MATSNSTDYKTTFRQIVEDAYTHIGSLEEGEDLGANALDFGERQLELMIKSWSTDGPKMWALARGELTLQDGVSQYTLNSLTKGRPLKIYDIQYRNTDDIDTPIGSDGKPQSRKEYFELPNKGLKSEIPVQVYFDPQYPESVLYVWPTPDANSNKLVFTYEHYIEDFDSTTNDVDLPQEWHECLSWSLALRLCGRESVPMQERQWIRGMAAEMQFKCDTFDNEFADIHFYAEA